MTIGCTSPERIDIGPDEVSSKADGMASHLSLVDKHRMDVSEPSDLAFYKNRLYTVSDRHSNIYKIDDDGDVLATIPVQGTDLEAVAVDNDGHFYIADESKAKVWQLTASGERKYSYDIDVSD